MLYRWVSKITSNIAQRTSTGFVRVRVGVGIQTCPVLFAGHNLVRNSPAFMTFALLNIGHVWSITLKYH